MNGWAAVVAHRPTSEFPQHLEALYRRFPFDRSLAQDPLAAVRPLARDPRHAEVAGLFAATIAVGRTASIRSSFADLLRRSGGDLTRVVDRMAAPGAEGAFDGFRHRWIRGDQLAYLAFRLHEIARSPGSLEAVFSAGLGGSGDFAAGLDALARALRGPPAGRPGPPAPAGYDRLFPSPLDGYRSPC